MRFLDLLGGMYRLIFIPCIKSLALSSIVFGILSGCAGSDLSGDIEEEKDEPELIENPMFIQDVMLDVEFIFNGNDWDLLRNESNLGRVNGTFGPVDPCFKYSEFYGSVIIDGNAFDNVNITKKGTYGSVDSNRPGLKINLEKGEGNDGRRLFDEKRFTLNNNKQDSSLIKQCLSYYIFNSAGIHSPLCNFASVTAEGKDLGIYTHVEAIKKPFLERTFGNKSGNLYEAERAGAFIESRVGHFQAKTNEDETDRAELYAVVDAMAANDEDLLSEMAKVINLDYFITFAAIEALVGHVDGFTGYQNNVYFYQNPDDNLLYFIPWGTDQTFRKTSFSSGRNNSPASIFLGNSLIQRLWQSTDFRTKYDAKLLEILDTVWNETDFIAMADKLAGVSGAKESEVANIRNFILERRSLVQAELDGQADREGNWTIFTEIDVPAPACNESEESDNEPDEEIEDVNNA